MAIVYEKSKGLTDVELHYCPGCNHGIIHKLVAESLVELVCEVLCSSMPSIRLGGENLPMTRVKARYRRLRFEHIAYVLDSLRLSESRIHNIKAYLLRALYDAPVTIGPFYSNAVRCDYAGD